MIWGVYILNPKCAPKTFLKQAIYMFICNIKKADNALIGSLPDKLYVTYLNVITVTVQAYVEQNAELNTT